MTNRVRAFFLSLTIVSMLLVSAFGTAGVAYADDGAPPETTETSAASGEEESTPEVAEEPDASDGSEETATPEVTEETATPEAGEATPEPEATAAPEVVEETAQPEESAATEEAAEPAEEPAAAPEEPILEQLPENTTVTVLNEEGEPQPLATQESADAIESAYDPIWCPEGQSPTPGANGCTESFSSFDELLSYLEANQDNASYQQAGTIYIQQGQYLGGESSVNFNNYELNNTKNFNLTLQGGWDTNDNSVDPADTTTFDNVPLTIGSSTNPWVGSLTLNNINITNVGSTTGLTLYTQGDITLTNVEVTTSQNGANLDAGGDVTIADSNFNQNKKKGANINADGDVKITNTTFNKNGATTGNGNTGKGLQVNGGGLVTLAGVEASNNQVFGANIKTTGAVTITDSFFTGNKSFTFVNNTKNWNGGYGLQVVTTDDITLDGVTASNNFFFGGHLEGADVKVIDSFFNSNSSGSENYPTGYGLEIKSTAAVTLDSIEASNNQWFGADVTAVGDVLVSDSVFNGNKSYKFYMQGAKGYHGYGLQVVTDGDISMSNVTATGNNLFGTRLDGGNVTIGNGTFSNNSSGSIKQLTGSGLQIVSTGVVSLFNIQANNNQLFGAFIEADGDVAIGGTNSFSGHRMYTYKCNKAKVAGGYGLKVISAGQIALDGITASDNFLYGANLDGNTVSLSNGVFDNNGSTIETWSVGYGLKITSNGNVSINSIQSNFNQVFGTDIASGGNVTISDGTFSNNRSTTPTDHMMLWYGYGLTVVTEDGTITLNAVEANFNNLWGANLTGGDVNINNSKFNNNVSDTMKFIDDTGLFVNSSGDVSINNSEFNENRLFGASIVAAGDVFISSSFFNDTRGITCMDRACKVLVYDGIGLKVVAGGIVDLDTVTADNNTVTGAHLEGSNIFIRDSTFNSTNSDDPKQPTGRGLEVISTGEVTLNNVQANDNDLFGAAIEAVGPVTITNSIFSGNASLVSGFHNFNYVGFGLLVLSTGAVDLDNVTANDNNLFGAALNGSLVEVTNSSFNSNGSGVVPTGEGLKIHSTGTVSLDNVETIDNELVGADIVADGAVTVSNSIFTGSSANGADGLKITSGGNVTLNNVTASGNMGDGVDVNGACTRTLSVNGGSFSNNGGYGVRTNIPYSPSGSPTFANNGAGNVFQGSNCFTTPASQNAQNMPGTGMPWWVFWWMKWDAQQAQGK